MPKLRPLIFALCAALLVMGLAGGLTHRWALEAALQADKARAETALRMTVNGLKGDLARFEAMPQLLADLDALRLMVSDPDHPLRRAAMNVLLQERAEALGASDIYVMRSDGETIAASNWKRPDSFIGQNFSYRPYFQEAAEGGHGRFYGVGTTSGVRGYYVSAPIYDHARRIKGVIAVKIDIDQIEQSWGGSEFLTLVTDPEGTVFLASEKALLYGSIHPLTADRRARNEASRRYADQRLHELNYQAESLYGVELVQLAPKTVAPTAYIATHQVMADAGWTAHVFLPSHAARVEARVMTIAVLLLLCAASFGVAVLLQRRARTFERQELERRTKVDLEHRVEARTAELKREIRERRATEAELRAAQANLLRVGKLAALGQMSAALSHEINQPLSAARNYADSAAILIERGDLARAKENLDHILTLIDRMSAIGKHLRNAARKPKDKLEAVHLAQILPETQVIMAGRLSAARATLELDLPPDLPPIKAGATRLQQVLVNLISNAADAVEGQSDRRITLSARREGPRVILTLRDRGQGIAPAIAERIFDPFFTTKGVGAGLGLGLSITYNIIRDFGGEISARAAVPGTAIDVSLQAFSDETP